MRMRTIVVPLDGRPHATVALPVAKVLAELEDATLHIVHVGERAFPPDAVLRRLGVTREELRGSVLDQPTGRPAAGILRLAGQVRDPGIVMCTHTGIRKPRGALGGVAEEVLRSASCPVVLVQPDRGHSPWRLERVVLPHNGTPASAAALEPAGDLVRRAGAHLLALHVAGPAAKQPTEPGTITTPRYMDQPQHEWPAWAAEFLERLRGLGHPPGAVRLQLSLAAGEPGPQIVHAAHEHQADLIVMAWHGQWDPEHARTMKMVIRDAACPVLVIRAAPERAAE